MQKIEERLKALEQKMLPEQLMVEVLLPDGTTEEMTVKEWWPKRSSCSWLRVTRGQNLNDLDLLLKYAEKEAWKEVPS